MFRFMERVAKRSILFASCGLLSLVGHLVFIGLPAWWPRSEPPRIYPPIVVDIVMEAVPDPVVEPAPAPEPEPPPEAEEIKPPEPEPEPKPVLPEPVPEPKVEAQTPPEVPRAEPPAPEIRVVNQPDHRAEESAYWNLVSQRIVSGTRTPRPARHSSSADRVVVELAIASDGHIEDSRITGDSPALGNRVKQAVRNADPLPPPPAHLPTPLEAQLPIRFESK